MSQIQYVQHTHAQACFHQSNCILRGLKNKVCGEKKRKLIFTRHLSYTHIRGASHMPLRWHSFIISSISQLAQKHYVKKSRSSLLQSAEGQGWSTHKTSKLNSSSAQACFLHFRRLRNPLQNPVSRVHLEQSYPKPSPSFSLY